MKKGVLLVLCLVVLVLLSNSFVVRAQPKPLVDSVERLNQYVNAVNSRDYESAYAIFLYPKATYSSFEKGWKNTEALEGHFGEFQPYRTKQTQGNVPGLLVGTLITGAVETYQGCYFMIAVDNTWYIEDFSFKLLYKREPTSSDIAKFTAFDCSSLRARMGLTTLPLPGNFEAIVELRELGLPVFRVGYKAVIAVDNLSVRDRATTAGNRVARLNTGDVVTILEGPLKSTRFIWWKIRTDGGKVGWVAALSEDGTQTLKLP